MTEGLQAWATPQLSWLWHALANVADKRGDVHLAEGTATVTLPLDAAERAEASGLVPSGPAGKKVKVDLADLSREVALRVPGMTLGDAITHLTGRALAAGAIQVAQARARKERVRDEIRSAAARVDIDVQSLIAHLDRIGLITRLDNVAGTEAPAAARLAMEVAATILALPSGQRVDRRLLVPGNPHALDEGLLPTLVLATLTAAGHIPRTGTPRTRWSQAGVDFDDIMGGLSMTGILPTGWAAPRGCVVTIPPRELARVSWPSLQQDGPNDGYVVVTENPSVLAAAAAMAETEGRDDVRVVCTLGTPSGGELDAVARMAEQGWKVVGRFDFDPAGIAHTNALLGRVPGATVWRMTAADYADLNPTVRFTGPVPQTPWDPQLRERMTESGRAAFEEDLMDPLLAAIREGFPDNGGA